MTGLTKNVIIAGEDMTSIINDAVAHKDMSAVKTRTNAVSKKAGVTSAKTVAKEIANAQKKELQKQNEASSTIANSTSETDSTKTTNNTAPDNNTSETVQSSTPEIKDTVEISQNAQVALKSEATK